MVLPKPLEISFRQEPKRIQEEGRVPYITDIELDGMVINARESVVSVLETRFGVVPAQISERLETIDDIDILKDILKQAVTTNSVQKFQLMLNEIPPFEGTSEE